MSEAEPIKGDRDLNPINPEDELLFDALEQLGLHYQGDVLSPSEGLIASNLFVDTIEKGPIVVRANADHSDHVENFETKVLGFLAKNNLPVPRLISYIDGSSEKLIDGKRVIAYEPISGETLASSSLDNPTIVKQAGELLSRLVVVNQLLSPSEDYPDGDNEFVIRITKDFLDKYPYIKNHKFFNDALTIVQSSEFIRRLQNTPQGIVHADYFYENIIQNDGRVVGVIDFGDAYFGAVLNDIVIGAMEFSIPESTEIWNQELLRIFLKPNASWLKENNIDFELFQKVLLMNCLRFSIYTYGFELEDDHDADINKNRYVKRFYTFRDELSDDLRSAFEETVRNSHD